MENEKLKSNESCYMLPVYNPIDNTWIWDNKDGTYDIITPAEYEARSKAMFPHRKSRYEVEPQ